MQEAQITERYYRPELDVLRFFAFASVFCLHISTQSTGFQPFRHSGQFGVCMFFLLSAFLIVTILLRERDATGTINLRAFAIRRVLRIWPLYFFALLASRLVGHFVASGFYMDQRALLEFSLLLGNLYVLHYGWVLGVVGPLWSISVEEQFYLVIPGMMRLGGKRALVVVFSATLLLSYGVLAWLGSHGASRTPGVWANSFVQFQFFAAGGLIAVLLYLKTLSLSAGTRLALAAAGFSLWVAAGTLFQLEVQSPSTAGKLVIGYLMVLAGTTAIFLSALDAKIKGLHALVYLGKISYGLYVYHSLYIWLVMRNNYGWHFTRFFQHHPKVGAILAFGATVVTASASYHFFERPILRYKLRFEAIRTRPA